MDNNSLTFRIFVSSTFSDLKAERNALQKYVFPRLRELSQKFGARFQPIDLRWGVSSEASLDQQAMQICLDEIQRCKDVSPRPNFIILMGDRYGWLPPMARIPKAEFDPLLDSLGEKEKQLLLEWYKLDENALPPEYRLKSREHSGDYEKYDDWQPVESQLHDILSNYIQNLPLSELQLVPYWASATHQEIIQGALTQEEAKEHVFCFIRDIQGIPQEFNLSAFIEVLSYRLERKYPNGLPIQLNDIIADLKAISPNPTAKAVSNYLLSKIRNTAEATLERECLQYIFQSLIDFSGKDFINFTEKDWEIDSIASEHLTKLKAQLAEELVGNLFLADSVQWKANQLPIGSNPYQCISTSHIGFLPDNLDQCEPILSEDYEPRNLCEATFKHLGKIILSEVNRIGKDEQKIKSITHLKVDPKLDEEGIEHLIFAGSLLQHFIGREQILADVQNYLQSSDSRIFVVAGEGGSGKSSLMAKIIEETQRNFSTHQLTFRFIGATPVSSDGRTLLQNLCKELARIFDQDENDIPTDFFDLVSKFYTLLQLASDNQPLIILLDSLDQLSVNLGARNLTWLPNELPQFVHLIVSTRMNEDTYANLIPKQPILKELTGLSDSEGEQLLKAWLDDDQRTLQTYQLKEVLDTFKASNNNPLYLKLAFEEARLWTSYEPQEQLANGVHGIIKENMIHRLADERNHGEVLVSHALGYLAASRFGLTEDELIDLLSRDPDVYEWFFNQTFHLPSDLIDLTIEYLGENPQLASRILVESYLDGEQLAIAWLKQQRTPPEPVLSFIRRIVQQETGPTLPVVLWSRLSFDLSPYLASRMVDSYALMWFYHRELGDVAKELFLSGDKSIYFHRNLANYFKNIGDPKGDLSWNGNSIHAISELPYHLTEAGERDKVYTLLTDFAFLESKAEKVGITKQVDKNGQEIIHSDGVHQLEQDYLYALEMLYGELNSEIDNQKPLIATARNEDNNLTIFCPVCRKVSPVSPEILNTTITCPQKDCGTPLKINPFVIDLNR